MAEKKKNFDPDGIGLADSGIYALPFTIDEAQVVLIPAPWGVTVTIGEGTQDGPKAVIDASKQIDYYHSSYGKDAWKIGLAMLPYHEWEDVYQKGLKLRKEVEEYLVGLENSKTDQALAERINAECAEFHARIEAEANQQLDKGKLVGLFGGDHSTPLGLIKALASRHEDFAVLQIDAHPDLRKDYEGFTFSHASIMTNVLKIPQVKKIVQVGIREFSGEEHDVIVGSNGRVKTFFDEDIKDRQYNGDTWKSIVDDIVKELPQNVYISFDVDGLKPTLVPNTGTPIPGGLEFSESMYLIKTIAKSGRKIIGFDVNEVSPGVTVIDANVGVFVLWNLSMWAAKSNDLKLLES